MTNQKVYQSINLNMHFIFLAGDILCHVENIAVIDGKDPLITADDSDGEDSEKEDDIIKPSDNLLLVGHLKDEECILEVHGKI